MGKNATLYSLLLGSMFLLLSGCGSDSTSGTKDTPLSKSNAGTNQLVNLNSSAEIQLDGSQSTGANGSNLNYAWLFSSKPETSTANLSSTNNVTSSFYADKQGTYSLELTVTDENSNISTSTVNIIVMPVLAFSGPDQSVKTGSTVQLDGQFTIYPNFNIDGSLSFPTDDISFLWSFVSVPTGSTAVISDTSKVNPTFVADLPGPYVVKLQVNDGFGITIDEMRITAFDMKAVAGEFQFVDIDTTVQLDGSASWNLNGSLSYTWAISAKPPGSNAVLSDVNAVDPTFVTDVEGEYRITLSVSNGVLENSDEVVIMISPYFTLPDPIAPIDPVAPYPIGVFNPTAYIGEDQTVKTATTVQLDGSASLCGFFGGVLPEGPSIPRCTFDPTDLSFTWSFVSIPTGSNATISDPNAVSPTFIVDLQGDYIVKLTLDDGTNVTTDEATITATDLNAIAGYDQFAPINNTVQLDGTQSWNLNGAVFYNWSFTSTPDGSVAVIANATTATPTFTPDVEGGYEIELLINDGGSNSDSDTITVQSFFFFPRNRSAYIGEDQTVKTATTVQLDGSASLCGFFDGALPQEPAIPGCNFDPPGASFTWSFVSIPTASNATISDPNAVSPTFIADLQGDYIVKLTLDDGTNVTTDEATITATDLNAVAGYDQFTSIDSTVQLDGTQSWNLNGTVFYNWSFTSVPEGSAAVIANATTATPTFTPDVEGGYEIELLINDGGSNSDSDITTVHSFFFYPIPFPMPTPMPLPLNN